MNLTLSPVRRDETLTVSRAGDVLTINGENFDFSGVPDGATLPRDAIASDWIAGDVTREGGVLTVPLILPHGAVPADRAEDMAATMFPEPITLTGDGPVDLPAHSLPTEEDT